MDRKIVCYLEINGKIDRSIERERKRENKCDTLKQCRSLLGFDGLSRTLGKRIFEHNWTKTIYFNNLKAHSFLLDYFYYTDLAG